MNQEELLAELRPWLDKVAQRYSTDHGTQQDLAQEGWIAAWRQLQDPRTPINDPVGWCKQAARVRMRKLIAGEKPTFGASRRAYGAKGEDLLFDADDPAWNALCRLEEDLEQAYHQGEIHRAISELSPARKEYVYVRFFIGMNTSELVEYFGYRPMSIWRGARKVLQERLAHLK